MIEWASSADPKVRVLLERHPRVSTVREGTSSGIEFSDGGWIRAVHVGDAESPVHGLVELMDNNPLVCADMASVPSAAATVALIALGPLAGAGLISEAPTLVVNFPAEADDVGRFVAPEGWSGGVLVHSEPLDLGGVAVATAMASIVTPADPDDIDALFEERYSRSFFVRRDEESAWDPDLVRGMPYALYRLTIAIDTPLSLLTVRVLADLDGKLGAAQIVHAMNVMAGFEESLGV